MFPGFYDIILRIFQVFQYSISGVAKHLDSPSHFSKYEIFCEPQLNTYLKGIQKKVFKMTNIIFIENI